MPVDPMEIVFHTVFLAGSDGPCISVTPSDDKTHLEAYYDETPEWYASEPLEEGPFAGMSVEYFAPKSKLHEGGE
jgi:hypothetical protein